MLNRILLSIVLSYSLLFIGTKDSDVNQNTVNAVLGDISFIEKFGTKPETTTNTDLRLTTHLEYVANKLRNADVSHLTPELRKKRLLLLSYLKQYIEAGSYPKNYVVPDRSQSVFIDKNGTICAVGYLVEKSVGRTVAEEINKQYKFSSVFDIKSKTFENWVSESGFTRKELAMIQPGYGPIPPQEPSNENKISSGNRLSSTILTGVNLATNIINTSLAFRQEQDKNIALAGMITGSGQLILGIANYPKNTSISENKRDLSILNIGLGSLTLVLSSYNLFKAKENNDESFAIRLKSFSLPKNSSGIGIGFSKRF